MSEGQKDVAQKPLAGLKVVELDGWGHRPECRLQAAE